jgi:hypothetical protein
MSSARRMLLGFRSRWMILMLESSWRYSIPLAIPRMMLYCCSQLSVFSSLDSVGTKCWIHIRWCKVNKDSSL